MDLSHRSEAVRTLLGRHGEGNRTMALDFSEQPIADARAALERLSAPFAFPCALSPEAALAGLWLYFGFERQAHEIAQELETPEGNFWHAIIHRREPDPWNAGYWFQRMGPHPIFEPLREAAAGASCRHPDAGFMPTRSWDPIAFVDFCETARREPGSAAEALAREIQLKEWQLLFDYCARTAR